MENFAYRCGLAFKFNTYRTSLKCRSQSDQNLHNPTKLVHQFATSCWQVILLSELGQNRVSAANRLLPTASFVQAHLFNAPSAVSCLVWFEYLTLFRHLTYCYLLPTKLKGPPLPPHTEQLQHSLFQLHHDRHRWGSIYVSQPTQCQHMVDFSRPNRCHCAIS